MLATRTLKPAPLRPARYCHANYGMAAPARKREPVMVTIPIGPVADDQPLPARTSDIEAGLGTAIHEAGHFVAASALGITVDSLRLDGAMNGRVVINRESFEAADGDDLAVALLAGQAAEELLSRDGIERAAWESDNSQVAAAIDRLPPGERIGARQRCLARAQALVNSRRDEIIKLARRLKAKAVMTGQEAAADSLSYASVRIVPAGGLERVSISNALGG